MGMMATNEPEGALPNGPQPPDISWCDIGRQVLVDIRGKEVQVAETTSHSWLANQLGHITGGILLAGLAPFGLHWLLGFFPGLKLSPTWENIIGSLIIVVIFVAWEAHAYRISVNDANGQFPLNTSLLRDNAVIAAFYLILGVPVAFVYREFALAGRVGLAAFLFILLVVAGAAAAVCWLRQKIVWQKAALPYLSRLATCAGTFDANAAKELQGIIHTAPPRARPRQVVVAGPPGCGRTCFAAAVGTEFAFRGARVRYLTMGALLEFAAQPVNPNFADDPGPTNIGYWRWSQAQVVVIDDIWPLLVSRRQQVEDMVQDFGNIFKNNLAPFAEVLRNCHTVWVIGDVAVERFAHEIRDYCRSDKVLLMQLSPDPNAPPIPDGMSIVKIRPPHSHASYVGPEDKS
jgi:hypothetical protein